MCPIIKFVGWLARGRHIRLVCKIPLLARALGRKARPSARATIGYLVYKYSTNDIYRLDCYSNLGFSVSCHIRIIYLRNSLFADQIIHCPIERAVLFSISSRPLGRTSDSIMHAHTSILPDASS